MDSPDDLVLATRTFPGPWIHGRGWDLRWLIFSAVAVPVVLAMVWMGINSTLLNLGVTAIVGGPHVWSTFLATYLDPRFRRAHWPVLVLATIGIPAFVVFMTLHNFQLLLSIFIFAASFHVIQQNAYLVDIYRRRAGTPESPWARVIDYGLLAFCFYPIAAYKLVNDNFYLGDIQILIPAITKTPATVWAVSLLFVFFAGAWLMKTAIEHRRGTLNVPKTLLIAVTATIAFFVPLMGSGRRLELAFQSVNTWHSIQYLAIVWIILKVRKERGLISSRFVASIAGPGRATWKFYGICVVLAFSLFGVVTALWKADPLRLAFEQYYYMGILSALLIHYALDGWFFTIANTQRASKETMPYTAPAMAYAASPQA